MNKEIDFSIDKETAGTFRYKEIVPDDEKPIVGTLYIRKSHIKGKRPEQVSVTIKEIATV
jgi:hypothetical protein|tara:strand:+ start:2586 stop:2765 length:180 start_codon:yes stop_codon:yes gene_type:complete